MTSLIAQIVFWCLLVLVSYVYVGYPLLLRLFPARRVQSKQTPDRPSVSILIAAYNEEDCIEATVRNKLALDYPEELVDVIVVSDGSEDRTDEILASIQHPRLQVMRQEPRAGKTSALNLAVEQACGEIIVFSDANSIFHSDALQHLVRPFEDPSVGYVTGSLTYQKQGESAVGEGIGLYMRYENLLRRLETRVGSVIGVNGGIDAVRRTLYRPMRKDHLPDFILPLRVIESGHRVVYCPQALLYEDSLDKGKDEYRMRVRVCLRSYHALREMKQLMSPLRGLVALQLFSHKVLRYLVFWMLLGLLISNLLLLDMWPYRILLAGQLTFYAAAFLGFLLESRVSQKLIRFPYYFTLLNTAAAHALMKFFRGQHQVLWTPRKGA